MSVLRSPFVLAYLKISESETFDLTSYIESFESDEDAEKDDSVTFRVKDTLAFDLLQNPNLTMGKIIIYQFGLMGQSVSDRKYCVIDDIDPDYGEGDNVSLVIGCTDKGVALKNSGSLNIWRNITASNIALAIAAKYSMSTKIDKTSKVYDEIAQGNRPDFAFLKYLASIENGGDYMSYCTGEELYFIKRKLASASVVTFVRGSYEVILFSPRWTEKEKDKGATSTSSIHVDPETGAITSLKNDSKTDTAVGGNVDLVLYNSAGYASKVIENQVKRSVADSKDLSDLPDILKQKFEGVDFPEQGRFINTANPDKEELANLLSYKNKKEKLQVLQGELTVLGNPLLAINDVVTVSKVAKLHEGNWYTWGVKNVIAGAFYRTTLRLSKNAIPDVATSNLTDTTKNSQNKTVGGVKGDTKEVEEVKYDAKGNKS